MRRELLTNIKHIIALLIGLLLLAYFLYHTMYGEKGYLKEQQLRAQVESSNADLQRVKTDRATLEHRVQGLRPESLDPDLLEEEARRQLGFTKPDEKVILTPEDQKPR